MIPPPQMDDTDAYIKELPNEMPDSGAPTTLSAIVQNILEEDIPEDVKHKLLMPLILVEAHQRHKETEPWREFDPLLQQEEKP